jgi:outer membrane protein assembly factor BamB
MRHSYTAKIREAALACVLAVIGVPASATNWMQSYVNAGHTGYNAKERTLSTANVSGLQLLWGQSVAGGVTGFALDNGVIYAQGQGSTIPDLAAIDATTGATKWTITTGSDNLNLSGTVAVAGKLVIAGCGFTDQQGYNYGGICAYNKSDGAQVWQYSGPCDCAPEAAVRAPLVVSGGAVYFGYNNGSTTSSYIAAVDAKTGNRSWAYVPPYGLYTDPPVVGNGMVYFTCNNEQSFSAVCALAQSTGASAWISADFGISTDLGLSLAKNVLYINADTANEFTALDATTGTAKWTVPGNSGYDPMAIAKNVLYARGSDSFVYTLSAKTGSAIWSANLNAAAAVSIANGVLYDDQQGAGSPETQAFDASNGTLLWTSPSPGSTLHPPPIVANGVLYITNTSCGQVCAYGLAGGRRRGGN